MGFFYYGRIGLIELVKRSISISSTEDSFSISNQGKFTLKRILIPFILGFLMGVISSYWTSIGKLHAFLIGCGFSILFLTIEVIATLLAKVFYTEIIINTKATELGITRHNLFSKKHSQSFEKFRPHQLVFKKFNQRGRKRYALELHGNRVISLLTLSNQKEVIRIQNLLESA